MKIRKLHVFKDVHNAGCATCGAYWVGRVADDQARDHAKATSHLVTITLTIRETHNAPESDYAPPAPAIAMPKALPPDLSMADYAAPRKLGGRIAYAGLDRDEKIVASRFHREAAGE